MYTLLIADDEKLICEAIQTVISSVLPDIKVVEVFNDGQQTYDYLCSNRVDILLLDIEMPSKSGLDISKLIYEQNCNSYIIIITAYQEFNYAKEAIKYGVGDFMSKPFSSQELVSSIQKAVIWLNQNHLIETHNWQTCKNLLQILCDNKTEIDYCNQVVLCNNSAKLTELWCTEVEVYDQFLCMPTIENQTPLLQTLAQYVERDDIQHSSFLLKNREDTITLLVFSREKPGLEFMSDSLNIISHYTGNVPQYTVNTYSSFSEYLIYLTFSREMDAFFDTLASDGSKYAKKQLANYIHSLSKEQLVLFTRFLSERYEVTVATSEEESAVLSVLDDLVNQAISTCQNNYIVDSATEYIKENCTSPSISLELVADFLSISKVYLSRIFKKCTGQNFSEYLLECRMDRAKQLLKSTHLSTVDIAEAVGYYNPAYFRTSFKTFFGMTPRQFRLKNQKGEE